MSTRILLLYLSLLRYSAAVPSSTRIDEVTAGPEWLLEPSPLIPGTARAPGRAANPYPNGIPDMPAGCDGEDPSHDCFNAMSSDTSGGYIYFDPNGQCTDSKDVPEGVPAQKDIIEEAIWDATSLAFYSSSFPQAGTGTRGQVSGQHWMGPNYAQFGARIGGNLKRVWQFKTSATSTSEYITLSCRDTENLCSTRQEGKSVGGYASTKSGYFGYYHYITLCPPFFTLDSLDKRITAIEEDLQKGDISKAGNMAWLKSTGQYFLHEMMHLRVANGANEPHITDIYIGLRPGQRPGESDKRAYGAKWVAFLARQPFYANGGAEYASVNADSYAILANSIFWWDTTGVFPNVPPKNVRSSASTSDYSTFDPIMLHVNLGNNSDVAMDGGTLRDSYLADLATYPGLEDALPILSSSLSSSTPSTIATQSQPTRSAAPPPAIDSCGDQYKFFFDSFEIYGAHFDPAKFGSNGEGLEQQIKGCGDLTHWSFSNVTGNAQGFQWYAAGRLPIGTKACVGRAVVSAGGASADGCHGAG